MEQGTNDWLEFRKNKIGASDAPIIMGVSPWKDIKTLWEEKVGLKESPAPNYHQQRGLLLEAAARQYFYLMTGHEVFPKVCISPTKDWMIASLDGLSKDGKVLVEIKCPGEKDHAIALNDQIPEKYYPQLQHQLEVLNLDTAYYLSFDGENGKIITFHRNQDYIDKLIEKEFEFYQCMINFMPPKTFATIQDPRWENAALLLQSVQKKQKELEIQEAMLKNTLIELSNGQNAEGNGVKLTKYVRKGSIDYKLILEELNVIVDEEMYRKEDTQTWKFTVNYS